MKNFCKLHQIFSSEPSNPVTLFVRQFQSLSPPSPKFKKHLSKVESSRKKQAIDRQLGGALLARKRVHVQSSEWKSVALTCQIHVTVTTFSQRARSCIQPFRPRFPSGYIHVVFPRDFHVLVSVGFGWNRERLRHSRSKRKERNVSLEEQGSRETRGQRMPWEGKERERETWARRVERGWEEERRERRRSSSLIGVELRRRRRRRRRRLLTWDKIRAGVLFNSPDPLLRDRLRGSVNGIFNSTIRVSWARKSHFDLRQDGTLVSKIC